jgi:hypothetical protein
MRRTRNATGLFGEGACSVTYCREEIALRHQRRFQASLELARRAQSHTQNVTEEQPAKEIQSPEVEDNCIAHLLREVEP